MVEDAGGANERATNASNYVVTITSIDGATTNVGDGIATMTVSASDYIIAIASIHKSVIENAIATVDAIASNYVVTITGIESEMALETVKASTSDYVVALSSIDATSAPERYAKTRGGGNSTRDGVVTIASIYNSILDSNSHASGANASDYIVTITGINGASFVVNTIIQAYLVNASDYVITITSINGAYFVINTIARKKIVVLVIENAREYVVTPVGIYSASVKNTAKLVLRDAEIVPTLTIDYVVASKSITNASI
jgi:hypothetical protein